jgi:hypothetical protein
MTNCKEFVLDDLMAITAIPVSDISASDVDSPVNKLTPTLDADTFNPTLENAIVIGRQAATAAGVLVPIQRNTGKAKDDTQDSVAGRLHTVTVNCEVDERGGELWAPIASMNNTPCSLRLERTPHHLVLSFRDGSQGFVAATDDTYQCTIERDGAKVSVAFRIQNLMGIQLLV